MASKRKIIEDMTVGIENRDRLLTAQQAQIVALKFEREVEKKWVHEKVERRGPARARLKNELAGLKEKVACQEEELNEIEYLGHDLPALDIEGPLEVARQMLTMLEDSQAARELLKMQLADAEKADNGKVNWFRTSEAGLEGRLQDAMRYSRELEEEIKRKDERYRNTCKVHDEECVGYIKARDRAAQIAVATERLLREREKMDEFELASPPPRADTYLLNSLRKELEELKAQMCASCRDWFPEEKRCRLDITVSGQYPPYGFKCGWWGSQEKKGLPDGCV